MSSPVFQAYGAVLRTKRRPPWPLVGLGLVFLGLAGWLLSLHHEGFAVITRHGFKQVKLGMSRTEVDALFGKALGTEGEACLRYGMPHMNAKNFAVYVVCYEGARVSSFRERRFGVTEVGSEAESPPEEPAPPTEP